MEVIRDNFDDAHISLLTEVLMAKEGFQKALLQSLPEQLEDNFIKLGQQVLADEEFRRQAFKLSMSNGEPDEADLVDFGGKLLALDEFRQALIKAVKANITWTDSSL